METSRIASIGAIAASLLLVAGFSAVEYLSSRKPMKELEEEAVSQVDYNYFVSSKVTDIQLIAASLRSFDFKGVPSFYDIGGILENPEAFKRTIDLFIERYKKRIDQFDVVAVFDSRGFLFGTFIAQALQKPCVMLRKVGKLPGPTVSVKYETEYSSEELCCSINSIKGGDRVLLIDDILATGGTLIAGISLVHALGASVFECAVVSTIEILRGWRKIHTTNLNGYSLSDIRIFSLVDARAVPLMPEGTRGSFNVRTDSEEFQKIKKALANCPREHVLIKYDNGSYGNTPMIQNLQAMLF